MARVFVTGATGFLGGHLVEALVARGDDVTCLVRETSKCDLLEALGVSSVVGNILEPNTLWGPVAKAEIVYHLAAMLKQPWHPEFLTTNADGVRHVAEACAAADRPPVLLAVSSVAAAGPSSADVPRVEADAPAPVSKYGRSKLNGELAARAVAASVPVTIVRPPIVFGERDSLVLPMFQMAGRGLFVVPTLAVARLSMVYVADLAQALISAAECGERLTADPVDAPAGAGIYFVAFDRQPTMSEFGALLASAVGRDDLRIVRTPSLITNIVGGIAEVVARLRGTPSLFNRDKTREATAGSWVYSPAKAGAQLGFEPAATLEDRLRQTADWYRGQGLL